jgi:hypothetical protein
LPDVIRALVFEPGQPPVSRSIENTLKAFQATVGGYLEMVRSPIPGTVIYCNEEGKLRGLPANRRHPGIGDVLVGTFFAVGFTAAGNETHLMPSQMEAIAAYFDGQAVA